MQTQAKLDTVLLHSTQQWYGFHITNDEQVEYDEEWQTQGYLSKKESRITPETRQFLCYLDFWT